MLWPLVAIAMVAMFTVLSMVSNPRAKGSWVWQTSMVVASIIAFWLCFMYALSHSSH